MSSKFKLEFRNTDRTLLPTRLDCQTNATCMHVWRQYRVHLLLGSSHLEWSETIKSYQQTQNDARRKKSAGQEVHWWLATSRMSERKSPRGKYNQITTRLCYCYCLTFICHSVGYQTAVRISFSIEHCISKAPVVNRSQLSSILSFFRRLNHIPVRFSLHFVNKHTKLPVTMGLSSKTVATKPFEGQKPGTSGLRKKVCKSDHLHNV